eukprot:TRINITY_DN0_c0_g3_i1.p1 TRINITY_DN0_c0_g3~~TRINITY_DN0_c0_g3_i1.p1  ORF type:complete len:177 (-),score=48.23 TRINITY_DN0_c0_g3_i1:909-1439(-)
MIRRPPRSTLSSSSAASDVYKRQGINAEYGDERDVAMDRLRYDTPWVRGTPRTAGLAEDTTIFAQIHFLPEPKQPAARKPLRAASRAPAPLATPEQAELAELARVAAMLADADSDGYLSRNEFATAVWELGDTSDKGWDDVLKELDTDGDGKVSVQEFVEFCANPHDYELVSAGRR